MLHVGCGLKLGIRISDLSLATSPLTSHHLHE